MDKANILNDLIRKRRSRYPKQYSEEIIPDEIILEILENAIWAPTHKLTQPWRFKIFSGNGKKRLADFQSDLYKEQSLKKGSFKEETYNSLKSKPLLASHIIAIGMVRDPKERLPEIEEVCAVACAVQNIYLSVHAYGYGGYWGTGGITYFEEAKSFFDLDINDKFLGFFYIGVPENNREIPGKRIPLEEKLNWIKD
jgi:nitroreductase